MVVSLELEDNSTLNAEVWEAAGLWIASPTITVHYWR